MLSRLRYHVSFSLVFVTLGTNRAPFAEFIMKMEAKNLNCRTKQNRIMKQIQTILTCIVLLLSKNISLQAGNILYNEKDLSSSLTTAMAQDSEGYIWIGTEYGLNRYDGITFKAYHHEEGNEASIKSDIVRSLHSDSEGKLWVGYLNGLQVYNPKTDGFENVSFANIQRPLNISNIHKDCPYDIMRILSLFWLIFPPNWFGMSLK